MKHFNTISKVLLIVVALVGLTIGMSTITGCSNSSDNVKTTVQDDVEKSAVQEAKCGEGKCGGDDAKAAVSDAKENVEEAKCGEGKCS